MIRYVFDADELLTIKDADKADAQKIGQALEEITAANSGRLTPQSVVEAARPPRSALHKHFEWKDAVAAEKYRLDQARSLIRSIHVEAPSTERGIARGWLSIRDKDGTSYRTLAETLTSADLQSKVLASAERDLLAFEARYRSLTDLCELIKNVRESIAVRRSMAGHDTRASA